MKNFIKAIFCLVILLSAQSVWAQNEANEFLRRGVKVGAETYRYRVYVPKNRNPNKKLPVVLLLHGNAANGYDNEITVTTYGKIIKKEFFSSAIVVLPQCASGDIWINEQMEQAIKALDQSVKEFNGDKSRISLIGFSSGGYGVWLTAVMNPNKFAAIVPIAGGIVPQNKLPAAIKPLIPSRINALWDAPNNYDALAEKIGDTAVWIFHAKEDEAVPVKEARNIVAALKRKRNKNVNYTELENTNHNQTFWKSFEEPAFYKWIAKQKK